MVQSKYIIFLQSHHLFNPFSIDLFADKNDFSWETIQKNRNKYYQSQMAILVNSAVKETMSFITSALSIHMNVGQNLLIDSSTVFMSIERTPAASLANRIIEQVGGAQIRIPSTLTLITDDNTSISIRVRQKMLLIDYLHSLFVFLVNYAATCSCRSYSIKIQYQSFHYSFSDHPRSKWKCNIGRNISE